MSKSARLLKGLVLLPLTLILIIAFNNCDKSSLSSSPSSSSVPSSAATSGAPTGAPSILNATPKPLAAVTTFRSPVASVDGKASNLCARSSTGISCYAFLPTGASIIQGPSLTDQNGWTMDRYYESFTTADIDGDGKADICARGAEGILCWISKGKDFSGDAIIGPALSDANGWSLPRYYKTILMADINGDGKADICARGAKGILCWISNGTGFSATPISGPPLSDGEGWWKPKYYRSIFMADINGDGKADICARSKDGIFCWLSNGDGFSSTPIAGPALTDANGWSLPRYYESIMVADINGDGKADICARGAEGILCWISNGSGFSATPITGPALSDANGWNLPRYYKTIMMADINGDRKADICARAADGIHCWTSSGNDFSTTPVDGPALSDAEGWASPVYYQSILMADINGDGKADICARAADGIHCWTSNGAGFSATPINGPSLSDDNGWTAPHYELTISGALRLGDRPEDKAVVLADYAGAIQEFRVSDNLTHIDTKKTIARLKAAHVNAYAFYISQTDAQRANPTDWNDFRDEFLPAAQAAGLEVWLYLLPPTEADENYYPYGHDYKQWASQAALLAREYPVLTTIAIDDFGLNTDLFSPQYVQQMMSSARAVAPWLKLNAVNYDISIDAQLNWATKVNSVPFVSAYSGSIDHVIFPYLHWGDGSQAPAILEQHSDQADQIEFNSAILKGQINQFLATNGDHDIPSSINANAAGDFAEVSEHLSAASSFSGAYPFRFRVAGFFSEATSGFYQLEVLVDGAVAWSVDATPQMQMNYVNLDLGQFLQGKNSATVVVRVQAQKASASYVRFSWDLPKGSWTLASQGGLSSSSHDYSAPDTAAIPMIVMIYDGGFGFSNAIPWRPSSQYLTDTNVTAKQAIDNGRAAGIIQYVMDMEEASTQWPIIRSLYGSW